MHVELFVEDASTKEALEVLINRLARGVGSFSFAITAFHGKEQMLAEIEQRLLPIARSRWADAVVLIIDQDDDDCLALKQTLAAAALDAGLPATGPRQRPINVAVRIAMSELESWFLGDPAAIRRAYPRLQRRDLRITGDVDVLPQAWERLQRPLLRRGYYEQRMPKTIVARRIAGHMAIEPGGNRSGSFNVLLGTLRALVDQARAEA